MMRPKSPVLACYWLCLLSAVAVRAQSAADTAPKTAPAKNLPEQNDVERYDSVGNLLADSFQKHPESTELSWFAQLPAQQRAEVVDELNQFTFSLMDPVKVKARIKDDYDMRWTFTQPKPQVQIKPPAKASGRTDALGVAGSECQLVAKAKEENDRRHLNVTIDWKPAQGSPGKLAANYAATPCRFTVSFDFDAAPEFDNFVPRKISTLGGITSVKLLKDGSVVLSVQPLKGAATQPFFTTKLWLQGTKDFVDQVTVKPGEYVGIVLVDALGAGNGGFMYQGANDGRLRFEARTWFYDIVPATKSSLELSPYDMSLEMPKK